MFNNLLSLLARGTGDGRPCIDQFKADWLRSNAAQRHEPRLAGLIHVLTVGVHLAPDTGLDSKLLRHEITLPAATTNSLTPPGDAAASLKSLKPPTATGGGARRLG